MPSIPEGKLEILHQHYEHSCSGLQRSIAQRERYFLFTLAALVVALYDLSAPGQLGLAVAIQIQEKAKLGIPDLAYLSELVWVLVFGLVLRYCQVVVHIERQYKYVHALEDLLAKEFSSPAFTREGRSYESHYPAFSAWAHRIYTIAFPGVLALVVGLRFLDGVQSPWPWPGMVWFGLALSFATFVTILLYLLAIHSKQKTSSSADGRKAAKVR